MTKTKIKYFYGLVIAFCLTLFMVTVNMGVTLCKENKVIALYDGSAVTTVMTDVKTEEVTMTVKGFSTSVKKLEGVTVNEKTYNVAAASGGASSTSRFIKLEVTKPFKVGVVAVSNNSSQSIVGVGVAEKYNAETDKTLLTANAEYVYGCSEQLPAGTYFLTFNNSTNIAEISVEIIANEEDTTNSTTIEDSTQNGTEVSANTSTNTSAKNDKNSTTNVFEKDKTLKILLGAIGGVVIVLILFFIGCKIFEKRKW